VTFDLVPILETIQRNVVYLIALTFFAWYPIFSSVLWVFTSIVFYLRREHRDPVPKPSMEYTPMATVLISAYNEEKHIEETIRGCLEIDYPKMEVVVVDDGSTDGTAKKIIPFAEAGKVRMIRKLTNEGKAMALNDAIRFTNGEIILVIDADSVPDPKILEVMVPHFSSPRVGAVTGNPRVYNRRSLLGKIQAIEFTSIISLQRRGARVWGKLLTMSGVVGAFHREAIMDAGLYSPEMATEDIDLTWKLQLKFYDIHYEPRAVVWMRVPKSLKGLWRQRKRWCTGLAQVLRRHHTSAFTWKTRRLWPVIAESFLSISWAYCFIGLTGLWVISYAAGYPPVGASPIPNWWGMLIGTMCLLQLLTGVILDRKYDKELPWYYLIAIFYPLIYWMMMAIVTALFTPVGYFRRVRRDMPTRWEPIRQTD
jgi:biofilm PGA synthesis N-glycosyltransferase PgaC